MKLHHYYFDSCLLILMLALTGCSDQSAEQVSPSRNNSHAVATKTDSTLETGTKPPGVDSDQKSDQKDDTTSCAAPFFEDVAELLGIDFVFDTGANGKAFMIESTGGGGGWIDYDRDGYPDLFLVQGGDPLLEKPHPQGDQLLRNISAKKFQSILEHSQIVDRYHGQGVAVGDYDNDGFDDIYITNVGPNVLLHNLGDGTFEEVTVFAGVGDPHWSSSAAWADLDLDGDLDLYVCNYTQYDVHDPIVCTKEDGSPGVCHPENLEAEDNQCYENLGNGQFRSVVKQWNLEAPDGKSLGVVVADFNRDSLPDIYVANDVTANHLFLGTGPGRFEEQGVAMGCAMDRLGHFQASMGIACGDYDRNGYPDLYITHFSNESNTLYQNLGDVGFRDVTSIQKFHKPTIPYLAFGTVMNDFNADGCMDIFMANGHIDDWRDKGDLWKMPAQLFSYQKNQWKEMTGQAGEYFKGTHLGRAVSQADFDNDGDPDLMIVQQGERIALLQNEKRDGNWLDIGLNGITTNRRGIGAIVEVTCGKTKIVKQLVAGSSFCTTHQPRLFFGLGESQGVCNIVVHWATLPPVSESMQVESGQSIDLRQTAPISIIEEASE